RRGGRGEASPLVFGTVRRQLCKPMVPASLVGGRCGQATRPRPPKPPPRARQPCTFSGRRRLLVGPTRNSMAAERHPNPSNDPLRPRRADFVGAAGEAPEDRAFGVEPVQPVPRPILIR